MASLGLRSERLAQPTSRRSWAERAIEQAPWLSFFAFYAVFANIPYWIASRAFHFTHIGWFCVEYAAVGLIALFVPWYLAAVLLFTLICADLLCGICETYYILMSACLQNIRAVTSFSTTHFLFAILVFLLVLLTAATAAFVPGKSLLKSHRWLAAGSLLAFAVLVLATNVLSLRAATGYLPYPLSARHDPDRLDLRASHALHLARTPLLQLVRLEHMDLGFLAEEAPSKGPWSDVPGALGAAVRAARILPGEGDRQLPNLVLVVVESWGRAQDAPLRDALVQPYLEPNLLARYQVLQGAVPFYGSTIPGEARELCGTSIGFHLVNASASDLQACFPNQLAALGYHRIAVHGMSGNLFNRIAWYRTIGFQEVLFRSDFDRQGLRDCTGFFTGNCDADIAAWIGRRLESDSSHPLFIHWMTLNSHLPVPVPSPLANGAPCSAALSLEPNSALCSWYQLVANVHRSVAQVAMETLARPTVFVIVGDHAPPFGDSAWRSRFSRSDVPYIILLPRTDRSDSKPMSTSSAPAAARHSSQ